MDPLRISTFAAFCILLAALPYRLRAQDATLRLFKERAESLADAKQFSEAVQLQQLSISLLESENPPDHESIVGCQLAISRYFRRDGKLDSAYHYLILAR